MVNDVMQEVLKENDGNSEQNMDGPLISVSNLELMNWATPSFNTLVVNVMERRVNFRTLEAKLQRSWTKNGSIQIIDLHDGFYQVRLSLASSKLHKTSYNIFLYTFLKRVGISMGKFLKVDRLTSIHSHGKFAGICVELDLEKPLTTHIYVRG
ncbi:hypothetical protein HKD37_14G040042 [Glycine soja]